MVDLLFASCVSMLWVITLIEVIFTALLFSRYAKTKNLIYLLSGLICVGLTYDAFVLAIGSFLTEGPLLLGLSRMRYVFHGGLIPLIFLICAYALDFQGFRMTAAWVFTAVLIVLGVADGFVRTIGAVEVAGICRYASVTAWVRTSASECPSNPSRWGMSTPPRMSFRPSTNRCTSYPCPILIAVHPLPPANSRPVPGPWPWSVLYSGRCLG